MKHLIIIIVVFVTGIASAESNANANIQTDFEFSSIDQVIGTVTFFEMMFYTNSICSDEKNHRTFPYF